MNQTTENSKASSTTNSGEIDAQLETNSQKPSKAAGDGRLIVAPCNDLQLKAPIRWLQLAWKDIKAAPKVSITWGLIIAIVSLFVAIMAYKLGKFALLALLLSGFTYIAPLLGVALYSVSRGLEMGKQPSFAYSFRFAKRLIPYASGFFLVQIVILLIWSRSGMIATAFFPTTEHEQTLFWEALKSGQLLFSGDGSTFLHFLLLGSIFGSIFASLTFITTAVSLPMLADKEVDMITVILTSINACLRNKAAMFFWAVLICIFLAIGMLTLFVGYIIIMPLLGYAAWHAYRETIDASSWEPRQIK